MKDEGLILIRGRGGGRKVRGSDAQWIIMRQNSKGVA
jgi:hypothetical protein